ncbi:L-lactate transporter [subsurface metagenome]
MIDRGIEYAAEIQEVEFTLRQAMRTPAYWLLILAQFGSGTTIVSVLIHFIPFLTDMGMSPAKAAATMTICGLSSIASRFLAPVLGDRVKRGTLPFLFGGATLLQAVGVTIFLLNQTIAMVYPFLIIYYIGHGGIVTLMQLIGGRYFSRKGFGSIQGTSMMFLTPVGLVAPIYTGWVYDTTGSYITAFTTIAAALAFATVIRFFTRPPKPPAEVTDIRKII